MRMGRDLDHGGFTTLSSKRLLMDLIGKPAVDHLRCAACMYPIHDVIGLCDGGRRHAKIMPHSVTRPNVADFQRWGLDWTPGKLGKPSRKPSSNRSPAPGLWCPRTSP